jgi:hypothetical protein
MLRGHDKGERKRSAFFLAYSEINFSAQQKNVLVETSQPRKHADFDGEPAKTRSGNPQTFRRAAPGLFARSRPGFFPARTYR